jgi:hypothetical protein
MKRFATVLAVISLTSAIAVARASAQNGPLITVDETGKGNVGGTPLTSSMQTDPFSGILTLRYQLPFPGVPGDVYLLEANNPGRISDVIRFDGNFSLYFFSDNDGAPIDPADVGLPPPVAALPIVSIPEVGPEGNNGAFYNPAGGLPGDNSAAASYHFVSDIPEPGTEMLVGVSLVGLLAIIRRRK